MKTRSFIAVAVLAGISLLIIGLEHSFAAKDRMPASPKIGVVSIKDVFDKSQIKIDVEKELSADGEKKFAELKKLEETLEADKAALSKRKEGSEDYMQLLQTIMLEQSKLDAQREFYQQELSVKEMRGKEKIYRKILEVIAIVAKEKGLDIILSRDDNYLSQPDTNPPAQSPSDLLLTTKTHKLLYFNPGLDVTADVITAMAKSAQQ
ncbi:MAG: OmpH family outer membrane protein [Sedimentisphaerales bacterium]